jgi:ABC-type lipoprotein export system ATPase subunit
MTGSPAGARRRVRAAGSREDAGVAVALRDVFCVHRTNEGDAAALQGLSLQVANSERLCVLGPSGAGKTTLLRVVAGLQPPSAGVVRVLGRDIGRLPARSRARIRHELIGFLDQHAESALPPDLPVARAIELPLALRGVARPQRRARVAELLDAARLLDRADALPEELSGGERQRTALCAALAHRPALLLADEPTGELDEQAAAAVRGLIAELARVQRTTVIVVSHDPATAADAHRAVRIRDGRIVEDRRGATGALVVGRGGWVQLPSDLLADAGIGGRAHVRGVPGGLIVTPVGDERSATSGEVRSATSGEAAAPYAGRAPTDRTAGSPPAWDPALVELRSVSRSRGRGAGRRLVIDEMSLALHPGRLTAVTGRSGVGKTTLLALLAALGVPDHGELLIDGRPLTGLGSEELAALRRRRIGYLPQEPSPIGFLSAEENVVLALALRDWERTQAAERATVVLARLGLSDRARQRVARLSAGEAQRVALARALACGRGLLIVDEPTSRLDEANASRVAELLAIAAHDDRQTVVCATHDPEVIRHADALVSLGSASAS